MEDLDLPLLHSIANGEERALRELMERHQRPLFHFVARMVRNHEDAEEIVAETFVRVHRHAGRYRPRAKVVTWLYSIATNLCRDLHRKQSRWKWLSLFSTSGPEVPNTDDRPLVDRISDQSSAADEELLHAERIARLQQLIDHLPPGLKAPFVLQVLEEKSQRECAEILNLSEKSVEARVYRARKRLKQAFDPET